MSNQATNATNRTQNYGLPLFVSNDKPSWLVDWNGAMALIDEVLTNINNVSQTAEQSVGNVTSQVESLTNLVGTLQTALDAAVQDIGAADSRITEMSEAIATLRTDVVNADNALNERISNTNKALSNSSDWIFDQQENTVGTPTLCGRFITDRATGVGYNIWRNTIRLVTTSDANGAFQIRSIVAPLKDQFHINPAHTSIRIGAGTGAMSGDVTTTACSYFDQDHFVTTLGEILTDANQSVVQITGKMVDRPNAQVYALVTFEYLSAHDA